MTESVVQRQRAIVIGASITGVLVARVLADHFREIVLIDRDTMTDKPVSRTTVPQEHHVHLLLQRGKSIMEGMYPGFLSELEKEGAEIVDLSHDVKWFQAGLWKNRWPTGIKAHYCTRTLVEHVLRRRATALPNVQLMDGTSVQDVLSAPGKLAVRGVRIATSDGQMTELDADLVVDTSGRGSPASTWLTKMGLPEVEREQVVSNLGYASRLYRRNADYSERWKVLLLSPRLPEDRRIAVVSPVENDCWMVTAGGWLGDYPQANVESFLAFLKGMPVPDVYDAVIKAEPLSDVRRFTMPGGLRRRYDRMPDWPSGFLVLGDALGSFNPIYSQGMSASAIQVEVLSAMIGQYLSGIVSGLEVQGGIARSIDPSWAQASAGDSRFPEVAPHQTLQNRLRGVYFDMLITASARNRDVLMSMLRVTNLIADGASLYRPRLVLSALKAGFIDWLRPDAVAKDV